MVLFCSGIDTVEWQDGLEKSRSELINIKRFISSDLEFPSNIGKFSQDAVMKE